MDPLSTVRAGMELIAWEYDDHTWRKLITHRRAHRRTLGATTEELDALQEFNPGTVVFTSTGVLFGEHPWPWRTAELSLSSIELLFGGWRALRFVFASKWELNREKLLIPLPPALASDVITMVKEDLLPRAKNPDLVIIGAEGPEVALFDPTTSDDPVARAIGWDPINPGGADYRTHEIIKVSPDRLELRAPSWHRATGITVTSVALLSSAAAFAAAGPILAVGCLSVAGAGLWLTLQHDAAVFDRDKGFWVGRRKGPAIESWVINLDRIYAIQLVSEVAIAKQNYVSWELNLVLESGERVNVVDHADWPAIHHHADLIAEFLDVPLWKGV